MFYICWCTRVRCVYLPIRRCIRVCVCSISKLMCIRSNMFPTHAHVHTGERPLRTVPMQLFDEAVQQFQCELAMDRHDLD